MTSEDVSSSASEQTDEVSSRDGFFVHDRRHKRKRDDDYDSSLEDDFKMESSEPQELDQPPMVANGVVDFPLAPVNAHLMCKLCKGYYRDPHTISECLCTFCKSCLFSAFSKGCHNCPDCNIDLGTDPFRTALADRTLQELVDKVLFPSLRELDDLQEREFYEKRGIRLKPEFQEEETDVNIIESHPNIVHQSMDDELDLTLQPESVPDGGFKIPSLARPCIRTSGSLKIVQLKKYLLNQLRTSSGDPGLIEILCNDGPVGNELSLIFVSRTIWLHPKEDLRLTYRFVDDYY